MKSLLNILQSNENIGNLCRKGLVLSNIQSKLLSIIPIELKQHIQVAGFLHYQLTIFTDTSMVASQIRLLSPKLIDHLNNHGIEITSIKVKVQIKKTIYTEKKNREMTPYALQKITDLINEISQSPLKTSLIALKQHCQK